MNALTHESIAINVTLGFFPELENSHGLATVLEAVQGFMNGGDKATARCGVSAQLGHPDSERINLCLHTAHALGCNFTRWQQDQSNEDVLNMFPAWEFHQVYKRENEAIDWRKRWKDVGGPALPEKKMIGLKNDPLWARLSLFGLPFAPFDIGSGMDLDGVFRSDAVELGILERHERINLPPFNSDFRAPLQKRAEEYFATLEDLEEE